MAHGTHYFGWVFGADGSNILTLLSGYCYFQGILKLLHVYVNLHVAFKFFFDVFVFA